MKYIIKMIGLSYLLLILCSSCFLFNKEPEPMTPWAKSYGGADFDFGRYINQINDDGFIVAGETQSFGAGDIDLWVLKLTADGAIEWQKSYGGADNDLFKAMDVTDDNGYIVLGITTSFGAGEYDLWVLKLTADGAVDWQKTYGGTGDDYGNSICSTSDGGFIITGRTSNDLLVLKLTSNGSLSWQHAYGGLEYENGYSIQETSDGSFIITGNTYSFGAEISDLWVIKLASDGSIL